MQISEMEQTIDKKLFVFLHNCIWIDYCKFSLLQRKHLSLGVNVLTNSSKISDITNSDIFQLNFSHSDEKAP